MRISFWNVIHSPLNRSKSSKLRKYSNAYSNFLLQLYYALLLNSSAFNSVFSLLHCCNSNWGDYFIIIAYKPIAKGICTEHQAPRLYDQKKPPRNVKDQLFSNEKKYSNIFDVPQLVTNYSYFGIWTMFTGFFFSRYLRQFYVLLSFSCSQMEIMFIFSNGWKNMLHIYITDAERSCTNRFLWCISFHWPHFIFLFFLYIVIWYRCRMQQKITIK